MIVKLLSGSYFYYTGKGFRPLPLLNSRLIGHMGESLELLKKYPIIIPEVFL